MIEYRSGDLFESGCQTLVNATNIEGIMGGGIALAFKEKYPEMFESYKAACWKNQHTVLRPHLWVDPPSVQTGLTKRKKWVLNIATKDYIRNYSTIANIAGGLEWLIHYYPVFGIKSIAVPALGCGLGGCDWREVQPVMHAFLSLLDIPVEIYVPH